MNQTPEQLILSIKDRLDHFQIKLKNRKNDNDYYILAENLLIPLLNSIFNCSLINLNKNNIIQPGIDLGDINCGLCFQITFQNDIGKIKHTVAKTLQHYWGIYKELYVVCLSEKQGKYSQQAINEVIGGKDFQFLVSKNIIDISDIAKQINFLSDKPEELKKIERHLTYILDGVKENNTSEENLENSSPRYVIEKFVEKKYSKNQYFNFIEGQEFLKNYSEFFSYIITYEGEIKNKIELGSNIFESIKSYIIKAKSENPLVITGIPGSGKSTFLWLLYKYLIVNSTEIPIYINLQDYLKFGDENEAFQNLSFDINFINSCLDKSYEVILLLDGCDDSFRHVVETSDEMISLILKEFGINKKIIGVNVSDNRFLVPKPENTRFNFTNEADSKINIQDISIYDKNYARFLDLFIKIKSYKNDVFSGTQLSNYLLNKIKKYKILRLDIFTLSIFYDKQSLIVYNKCETLSDFYKQLCFENIGNSKESDLLTLSDLAFEFYIKKKQIENVNSKGWKLANSNLTIRDYLLAFQIVHRLNKIGTFDYNHTKKDYESFNFVYTDLINNFCKEIMNSDKLIQKRVYEAIIKIFRKVNLTAQTHFCYLLGRFTNQHEKDGAINFLTLKLEEAEKSKSMYAENQFLLYSRTIYISLIYLGVKKCSNRYIEKLLSNPKWDSINRGFHREYYGDILFDPGLQSLTLEDNIEEDFSNTFNKLYRKISECLNQKDNYNLFEIELYTLCSLAQHRQANKNGNIESNQLNAIHQIIINIVDSRRVKDSTALKKYIEFLSIILSKGKYIPNGAFLDQIYHIKEQDRAGWIERGLKGTEKVSSHMYGAYLIGKICLPDQLLDNPDYKKNDILEMILIHDLGEAITGDKTPMHKSHEDREKEKKAIQLISMLGNYFGNELGSIGNIWSSFESKNDDNINIQIANDLDKLDNLMQLYIYVVKQKKEIPDYEDWKSKLISSIKSEQGRKICELIVEFYESPELSNYLNIFLV